MSGTVILLRIQLLETSSCQEQARLGEVLVGVKKSLSAFVWGRDLPCHK